MRELELEPGRKYKMITLASKPPIFGKELSIWESCCTFCQNERRIGQIAVIAKLNLVNLSPLPAASILCSMLQTFICFICHGNHRKTIVSSVSFCESYINLLLTWPQGPKCGYIVLSLVNSSCLEIWNFFLKLRSYIMHIFPLMFIYNLMYKNWCRSFLALWWS